MVRKLSYLTHSPKNLDGEADGSADGEADGSADGEADGSTDGEADGSALGVVCVRCTVGSAHTGVDPAL